MHDRQLQVFTTIVDCGTLTAASKELHIAQSALSRHLQNIEDEYGARLLNRGSRRLDLTAEGKVVYEYAKSAIAQSDSIKKEVTDMAKGVAGTLRIGAAPNILSLWMEQVMPKFCKKYPNINFEVFEGTSTSLVDKLNSGILDIAIVRLPVPTDNLTIHRQYPDPLCVAYDKSRLNFFPGREYVTLDDMKDLPVIMTRHWNSFFLPLCTKFNVLPNILSISDNVVTALDIAYFMDACALIPYRTVQRFARKEMVVLPIKNEMIQYDNALVTVKDRYLPKLAVNFIDAVLDIPQEILPYEEG